MSFGLVQSTLLWLPSSLRALAKMRQTPSIQNLLSASFTSTDPSEDRVSKGPPGCLGPLPDVEKSNSGSSATSLRFAMSWRGLPEIFSQGICVQTSKNCCLR